MRLLYLLSILLLSAVPAQAQTCTSAPSCAALGYDKTSSDCTGQAMLKCPFDQSKVFCAGTSACGGGSGTPDGSGCNDGDFLFADKTCSVVLLSGKNPIGIVFSSENRLAVALNERKLVWSVDSSEIGSAAQGTSGKSNTAAILAYGEANSIEFPAAEYCNSYSTGGTKAGDWFLPSIEELKLLSNNFSEINNALKLLGKPTLPEGENEYYWSSSELNRDNFYAKKLMLSSGYTKYDNKKGSLRVRPVLQY